MFTPPIIKKTRDVDFYDHTLRVFVLNNSESQAFNAWYKQAQESNDPNVLAELQKFINDHLEGVYDSTMTKIDDEISIEGIYPLDLSLIVNALIMPSQDEVAAAQKKMMHTPKIARRK